MMRSRFGNAFSTVSCCVPGLLTLAGRLAAAVSLERAIAGLATVPPCDHESECYVQCAEAEHQETISPRRRSQHRCGSDHHEAESHYGHDSHRKCSPSDDRGAIE